MSAYLIVDIAHTQETKWLWQRLIPESSQPTIIHTHKEIAERELLRLKRVHPEGEFVLFAAESTTETVSDERGVIAHNLVPFMMGEFL
jgi:hypothetical protein